MKLYAKYFILAIFWGILQTLFYFRESKIVLFSDIMFVSSFYKPFFFITSIIDMCMNYIPLFLLQIIYGTYIYRHFCITSVYFFSRCANRQVWFIKEAIKLYGYIVVYLLLMIVSGTLFCMVNFRVYFDEGSNYLLFYYMLIFSLWLYITTISINLIAMFIGSNNSTGIIIGVQIILLLLLDVFDSLIPFDNNKIENGRLLELNPISHLVMSWHSSRILSVNQLANILNIDFNFYNSIKYMGTLAIILTIAGCIIIQRVQFIAINKETGGV
ncbi:MAG: hypothetical protein WCD89_22205 [Anaerocolumna sp.]